uniref:selenocysteine lyase-like n=1 Tax=Styela clava TaxID=7725 RepID=UPI00193A7A76|nr:selenocysteine lyase-like [Styela clava]
MNVKNNISNTIYLDYNATTPLEDEVLETITDALKNTWGNPSSSYPEGGKAKATITTARKQVAKSINAQSSDIVFTSGGTEANNWVITTAIEHFKITQVKSQHQGEQRLKPHIVTTTIEHDAVTLPLINLKDKGEIDVTFVPVDKECRCVTVDYIVDAILPNTCLVTIMMANNETGVIMPIKEISEKISAMESESLRPLIHTDAAQALGKILVDVEDLGVDYLTLVGHKFYGPRIGALYVRGLGEGGAPLYPLFFGGAQERNYRPGTENTPMIAGLGKAVMIANDDLKSISEHMREIRDYLEKRLLAEFGDSNVKLNCSLAPRLPNTSSVSFIGKNMEGYKVLQNIKGFVCSTGSACHSNECKPSQVLLNFHVPFDIATNTIRISTGRSTTKEDIDAVVTELKDVISSLSEIAI